MSRRRRVLVIGTGTSLSHTGRAAALASMLAPTRFDVAMACDQRYQALLGPNVEAVTIHSTSPERAMRNARQARPVIDVAGFRANVDEDLHLFRQLHPDVVIGDLRQSLAVSSRVAGVPYVTLLDPHWSPYARTRFELAEHWLADRLGYPIARRVFRLLYPIGSAVHTLSFNRVSLERGLRPVSLDVRRAYAAADHVLYPSVPDLVPTDRPPAHHTYMGPIVWSPRVPDPAWWADVPPDRPIVYVGLGTTGHAALLPTLLEALADLPISVIAATAARTRITRPPRNAFVAPYLSGTAAASRSQLVICNGGTMSTQQAFSAGAPVLGIVSNFDQMVFMQTVVSAGAGERLRESEATGPRVRQLVEHILSSSAYRQNASRLATIFRSYDSPAIVSGIVTRLSER